MPTTEKIKILDCKGLKLKEVLLTTSVWLRGLDLLNWDPRDEHIGASEVNLLNADLILSPYKYKKYAFHSGYAGGFKRVFASELLKNNPERAIKISLRGYLPKNKSARRMIKRVKVFKNNETN